MNNIRATKAINERELKLGIKASWHDDYKDSAYIYIGGLDQGLTEGDIITIFSQYGEPVDINLPKEKPPIVASTSTNNPSSSSTIPIIQKQNINNNKKSRGFCFLMYENQLSTNLAVDNLNGSIILGRTIRVDHCKNYKQLERNQDGKMVERDGDLSERLNARPELHITHHLTPGKEEEGDGKDSDENDSLDPEDPMAGYLREERRKRSAKKHEHRHHKHSRKHHEKQVETEEERATRKKAKRIKKSIKSNLDDDSSKRYDKNETRDNDRYEPQDAGRNFRRLDRDR